MFNGKKKTISKCRSSVLRVLAMLILTEFNSKQVSTNTNFTGRRKLTREEIGFMFVPESLTSYKSIAFYYSLQVIFDRSFMIIAILSRLCLKHFSQLSTDAMDEGVFRLISRICNPIFWHCGF